MVVVFMSVVCAVSQSCLMRLGSEVLQVPAENMLSRCLLSCASFPCLILVILGITPEIKILAFIHLFKIF